MLTKTQQEMLLMLLHKYVEDSGGIGSELPQTIPALAEDLAMSQDVTDDASDFHRREIERIYNTETDTVIDREQHHPKFEF